MKMSDINRSYNLSEIYNRFQKEQHKPVKKLMSQYNTEKGHDFLQFILRILPNVSNGAGGYWGTFPEAINNVAKIWDCQASWWAYFESFSSYYAEMSLITSWLEKAGSIKNILGIGSGPGLMELFIEQTFRERIESIYCTDIAPLMVKQAQNNKLRYETEYEKESSLIFKVCNFQDLPFKSESMDVVISCKVLHWCHDVNTALSELNRVLKRGGFGILFLSNYSLGVHTDIDSFKSHEKISPGKLGSNLLSRGFNILDYKDIILPDSFGQAGVGSVCDYAIFFKKH